MGAAFSRQLKRKANKRNSLQNAKRVSSTNAFSEDEELNTLRRQLNENIEMFLLNNLLLSVQFFENFEREISELRKCNVSKIESDTNFKLLDHQKHCLLPDTLHETINKHVEIRPEHGSRKHTSEPLRSTRVLIVHDNVEVSDLYENIEYSSALDIPVYKCQIEDTPYKGYVQLLVKEVENKWKPETNKSNIRTQSKTTTDRPGLAINIDSSPLSSEYEEVDQVTKSPGRIFLEELRQQVEPTLKNNHKSPSIYSDTFDKPKSILTPTEKRISAIKNNQGLINSTQYRSQFMTQIDASLPSATPMRNLLSSKKDESDDDTDTDDGYSKINEEFALKPLNEMRGGNQEASTTALPPECITTIHNKIIKFEPLDFEELERKYPNPRDPRRKQRTLIPNLFEVKDYLNSLVFAADFGDKFILHLANVLGFDAEEAQRSLMQGAIIYTNKVYDYQIHCIEIIPSLVAPWPISASEWTFRKRPIIINEKTNIKYRWPTRCMVDKIGKMHCHVLPVGYVPKRGTNINRAIQWQLAFPAAERFLETWCLTHAQIRCYMFTLVLYKVFMEVRDTKLGLNVDHIRTHLFWECEDNFVDWDDNLLGQKLLIFLKHLYTCLKYSKLPDYFVRGRNLLANIPHSDMMKAHRKLHEILENPVVYIIYALRNLRYKGNFYPVLNYKQLYSIITSPNIYNIINPAIPIKDNDIYDSDESDEFKINDMDFWERQRMVDPHAQWYKIAHEQINQEKKQEKKALHSAGRVSTDSINLKVKVYPSVEIGRKILILKLFISHFIAMAEKSNEFDAINQGWMYLKRAKNLTEILNDEASAEEEVKEFLILIKQVSDTLNKTSEKHKKKDKKLKRQNSRTIFTSPFQRQKIQKPQVFINDELTSCNNNNDNDGDKIIPTKQKKDKETIIKRQFSNEKDTDYIRKINVMADVHQSMEKEHIINKTPIINLDMNNYTHESGKRTFSLSESTDF